MDAMARSGPAPLIDERWFIPRTLDDARALKRALVDVGVPHSQARGVVTWLIELTEHRSDDPSSNLTRSRYRQVLARLGEPPWGREPNESMGA